MSFANKFWNAVDRIKEANALANAERENKSFGNNFENVNIIPMNYTGGRPKEYAREIKSTLTGKTIAYEDVYGEWTIANDAYDEEFEAMKALSYPRG